MARKCWAAGLGNCSGVLSDEHPISQHIFDSEVLDVHGASWLPDAVRSLPQRRISAQVLCTTHNSALSPLDTAIGDFAKNLRRVNRAHSRAVVNVHGPTIERWCVKALLGSIAAGFHRPGGHRVVMEDVPQHLVDFVFGTAQLPVGWGLHLVTYECAFEQETEAIAWKPIVGNAAGSNIVGLLVGLPPIAFALALAPGDITPVLQNMKLLSHGEWRETHAFYRPPQMTCQGSDDSEIVINIQW